MLPIVPLLVRDFDQYAMSWSVDGRLLAFQELHPETGSDVWVLPVGEEPEPIVRTTANEYSPVLSPDGRFIVYVSDQSGRPEVYVRSFVDDRVLGVSIDGGEEPLWARNGGELFFRQGDRLLSAAVATETALAVARPTVVFDMPFDRDAGSAVSAFYDVSPDAERFLVVSDRATTEIKIIQNWFAELERRVPTN